MPLKQKKKTSPSFKDDREYLKVITRKMLCRLEACLEVDLFTKASEVKSNDALYALIFGSKASLATTLISLAELLQQLHSEETSTKASSSETLTLSAADIALVESFVEKIKQPVNQA